MYVHVQSKAEPQRTRNLKLYSLLNLNSFYKCGEEICFEPRNVRHAIPPSSSLSISITSFFFKMTFSFKNKSGLLLFLMLFLIEERIISGFSLSGGGPRLSRSFSHRQTAFFETQRRRPGPLFVSSSIPVVPEGDGSSFSDNHQQAPKIEKSRVASASFNLVKTTIGSGVLALPSGLACMTNDPAM